MSRWIDNLLYKIRKRRFCKLNGWFCPDCIYHDFIFEGATFRGNKCRYGNSSKKPNNSKVSEKPTGSEKPNNSKERSE